MICPNCHAETGGVTERQSGHIGVVCDECHTWDYQENWDKAEREHNRKQEAQSKLEYCIGCGTEMIGVIDNDPNGAENCNCARCRAEESHDFDVEPDIEFDRSGRVIEKVGEWEDLGLLDNGSRKFKHTLTELSFFVHPQLGVYDFNSLPCAVRADGTLNIVSKHPVDLAGKLLLGHV